MTRPVFSTTSLIWWLVFFLVVDIPTTVVSFPGTDHPYIPPEASDSRSPCPALNTLANHGFLPRNGVDIPTADIVNTARDIFAVSGTESIISKLLPTDVIRQHNETGVSILTLDDMWAVDLDASLSYQDFYFEPGRLLNETLLDAFEAAAGDDLMLTWEEMADWRDIRLKDSLLRNPTTEFTESSIGNMAFHTAALFQAFVGYDISFGRVPIRAVTAFLRENRFPNDFVPRIDRGELPRNIWSDPLFGSMRQFFQDRILQTVPIASLGTSEPSMMDCVSAFSNLQFDITEYEQYPVYFREESKVTLAQAGQYLGPENIEEYVRFADETSPYVDVVETIRSQSFFKSVNPQTGVCTFLVQTVTKPEMNPAFTHEATLLLGILLQIEYDFHEAYIPNINVYYEQDFLNFFFGTVLNNDSTRNYICEVSEKSCPSTNEGMSRQDCVDELESLPALSDGAFDGHDYGCRVLHAVFAETNPNHCAHISFEPQEDPNGHVKCQESKMVDPFTLFDPEDIEDFRDWLESPESLIESRSGFRILTLDKPVNKAQMVWFGLVVPSLLFCGIFCCMRRKEATRDPEHNPSASKSENGLLANKLRRLWIIGLVMAACLLVVNVLVGCVMVFVVPVLHPDWDEYEPYESELADKYRGSLSRAGDTAPFFIMTDEQFWVYVGFLLWCTCVLTGFGLEVFVWFQFIHIEWSQRVERLWRLVQFVFPLMLASALGMALRGNFLSLIFAVLGLWKFGFPETLMYLYLGLFSQENGSLRRISDFLNGVGTMIHHGATSMFICLILSGTIPPSRYALNGPLILIVQHWVVLLSYANKPLYAGIQLVLEYYFEWLVLSDFAEIYHWHWTAGLVAAVMLIAHWMYLVAAVLELFSNSGQGSTSPDYSCGAQHDNVHTRGRKTILNVVQALDDETDSECTINQERFHHPAEDESDYLS